MVASAMPSPVVAIIGAISVYIAMNNEEQDVKNILVLQNWLERIRKGSDK